MKTPFSFSLRSTGLALVAVVGLVCAAQAVNIRQVFPVSKQQIFSGAPGGSLSGSTSYSAAQCFASSVNCSAVVVYGGTLKNFQVATVTSPGAGQTYVYTLEVFSTPGSPSDSALTCTISGASAKTCSDTTDVVSIAAGQLWSVKLVTSGSAATTGIWAASAELDTP